MWRNWSVHILEFGVVYKDVVLSLQAIHNVYKRNQCQAEGIIFENIDVTYPVSFLINGLQK